MGHEAHSAEWLLRDSRDHWWNPDFLALMARRWELRRVRHLLDAGCGVGHWGQALCQVLPRTAKVTGVDRDPTWIDAARARARRLGLSRRCAYVAAPVESLPFADETFDGVTCQTLLIHVRDPQKTLREMLRVLKPGGLLMAAEPNNRIASLLQTNGSAREPLERTLQGVSDALIYERGKQRRGLGHSSFGDLVPGLWAAMGLKDIRVYLSDKAAPMLPPYSTPEERILRRELAAWLRRPPGKDEARKNHLAGGGTRVTFERSWRRTVADARRDLAQMRWRRYAAGGGSLMYLVSGRKHR